MTTTAVKDLRLHTFTDAEIETIADALNIASAHYRMLAEVLPSRTLPGFKQTCEQQSADARALQLKIEAAA